jgi:hypothetical protein
MSVEPSDPTQIRVLAVTVDDITSAIEANIRRDAEAVLRVTPPFSGRMRARLHRQGAEDDYEEPTPLHIPPEQFVEAIPGFPSPDETEDELRTAPEVTYTPTRHRKRYQTAVEAWRRNLQESIVPSVRIETPDGRHEVRVAPLG